ncbi:hypothetical protein ACQ7DA_10885 [Zafaria sp. J156]|uniref:hypothetical protein n=1 Tax=Zafaria sp. J156 TaxID=3116490 RepID=UPI002E760CB7|nr:hypothetical protein [Zafaria sp. J156]MEE1621684.1 hypothetical protein [Zafaria sp. J156]
MTEPSRRSPRYVFAVIAAVVVVFLVSRDLSAGSGLSPWTWAVIGVVVLTQFALLVPRRRDRG